MHQIASAKLPERGATPKNLQTHELKVETRPKTELEQSVLDARREQHKLEAKVKESQTLLGRVSNARLSLGSPQEPKHVQLQRAEAVLPPPVLMGSSISMVDSFDRESTADEEAWASLDNIVECEAGADASAAVVRVSAKKAVPQIGTRKLFPSSSPRSPRSTATATATATSLKTEQRPADSAWSAGNTTCCAVKRPTPPAASASARSQAPPPRASGSGGRRDIAGAVDRAHS